MAELLAQFREENKRRVHVVRGIRQTHAGDDDPAVDAGADEKFVPARQAFRPRTRRGVFHAQHHFCRFRRSRPHRHPTTRTPHRNGLKNKFPRRHRRRRQPLSAMHREHPAENHEADAQRQALHGEQHQRDEIHLIHAGKLNPERAGAKLFFAATFRQPRQILAVAGGQRQRHKLRRVVGMPGEDEFFQRGQLGFRRLEKD